MTREAKRLDTEGHALKLLAVSGGSWISAHELATKYDADWRSIARALRRLASQGAIRQREVEVVDESYRRKLRREYRLQVEAPSLAFIPPFDPSGFKVLGVRVNRME
jgi:hypothetical protein